MARRRRHTLESAIHKLGLIVGYASNAPDWVGNVATAIREVIVALDSHIGTVEGRDGLLPEILESAPRLANRVDRVRGDHASLRETALEVLALTSSTDSVDVDAVRTGCLELIHELQLHRQHGADLVYDAYDIDIGGG